LSVQPTRVSIESFCLAVTSGGTPSRANSRYWEEGTLPWYKTAELKDWYLNDAEERITQEGLSGSSAKIFPPNTVLMAMYGDGKTITSLGILREEAATNQACCAMVVDPAKCNFLYFFYALKYHRHELLKLVVAGAQRNLSVGIIRKFRILSHPLPVQTRIADILSPYDDLIENNRRRMALLEEAARRLYREWFVRLRFPGHEHTRITNGVPAGWQRGILSDVAELNRASLPNSYDGELDYIDISSVSPGLINGTKRFDFKDAPSRARRIVMHGDLIWSCVRPNRRLYAVIWQPSPNLIASTGFVVITPTYLPTAFLLQATTTNTFVGYLENRARGVAYPAVVAGDFARAELLVPPHSLVRSFNDFAEPLIAQGNTLRLQNQKLRAARDLLLPKLMSEEIVI